MRACILVATSKAPGPLAKKILKITGVEDAFPARGRKEVVVRVSLRGMAHLAEVVDRISAADGVVVSETMLEIPQVVPR